ncbi:MAG: energy-coupling factor ABC transporter ATP-binding protein [Paracoccus sp. (in: a-proteobacteria)]
MSVVNRQSLRFEIGASEKYEPSIAEIVLKDVLFKIDDRPILDRLSVDISGRRVGVVGRNGSGKSTLAKLLAGLITPEQGKVSLNGIDPARDRKAALRQVGILFQNPDHQIIFPTVVEEICFGLRQLGLDKATAKREARAVLDQFGKANWVDAHVTALSQGQRHLLCLMAVAAMRPALIILDEPFTGLDIPTRMQLHRYLEAYQGSLINISHEPHDFEGYDQILWLDKGRVVKQGVTNDVLPAFYAEMTRQGGWDDLSDLTG